MSRSARLHGWGRCSPVRTAATVFQQEVAVRCSQWAAANGLGADGMVPVDVRAGDPQPARHRRLRGSMGRLPSSLLSSEVALMTRNPTIACAGYDVTFTPVKSVSALWAVAPQAMAAQIEEAHNAAVADALAYLEQRVLFSAVAMGGVRWRHPADRVRVHTSGFAGGGIRNLH